MKRFVSILLIAIVGVPWTAFSAAKSDACAMPRTSAAPACSSCTAVSAPPSGATLRANCCRFLPTPESGPAQAGSIGVTPKPLQSPDLAGAIPAISGQSIPAASARQTVFPRGASPPPAPPTHTTHLLL